MQVTTYQDLIDNDHAGLMAECAAQYPMHETIGAANMNTCPCPDMNCAITATQRAYCRRALSVAYATRNRAAIAKIKDALSGCPSLVRSNGGAAEALSRSADAIIKWAEHNGAEVG